MSINDTVSMMNPARYTTSQAANLVGRSPDTLRRWREEGRCSPSDSKKFGDLNVPLYTDEDIVAMVKLASTIRRGPEPGTPRKPPQ